MKKISRIIFISVFFGSFVLFNFTIVNAATTASPTETTTAEMHQTDSVESANATTPEHSEDTGVVGLFGLNWKLFLAQLINFAIVLFVLWKWVWKPVTSGMEARTKKIEDSLLTANKIENEKILFEEWKSAEMSKARTEATSIINEAKTTAVRTKDQILEQTKLEQQGIIDRTKVQLAKEQELAVSEAKQQLAELVVIATEKLLRSKLDTKSDQKLINAALKDREE